MIYFEERKPSLFVLVKRSLYICGGAEFEMEVDLIEFSRLCLLLLLLLQHLLPHLIFILAGELRILYQQVFITSAVVTCIIIPPYEASTTF